MIHGDLRAALLRPDGVVMTRSEAVKWFGRSDAIGSAVGLAGQPMILRAVIADLPAYQSDLSNGIFVAGSAAASPLRPRSEPPGGFSIGARTYLKLQAGVDPATIERRYAPLIDGMLPPPMRGAYAMKLLRIDRLALYEGFHPAARERLQIGSLVAALVLFIAVANFINLSVALSLRRRREIGVRKANGASRSQIAAQFLGESVTTVLIAALLAAAAVELALPSLSDFLGVPAMFDYVEHPSLILWLLLGVVTLGLLAGAYPALLVASQSAAAVLRPQVAAGRSLLRSVLVAGQFAILTALIIMLAVVYQQRSFAMHEALRADVDQLLTVSADCPEAFRLEVARLPGVRGVSCSGTELLDGSVFAFVQHGDRRIPTDIMSMLPGNFALYGIAPVAGSLATLPAAGEQKVSRIVINETAVRRFGYARPEAAIGQTIAVPPSGPGPDVRAQVVAVVPDFALYSVEAAIKPTIYVDRARGPNGAGLVTVKLAGREIPQTLAAIDALWRGTGNQTPIRRAFLSEHLEQLYRDLQRNTQLFGAFAGIAAFLACLGLVGLSVSAAERRTKEIGVRKVLGATTGQILTLLLFRLGRPVLWASLLAWPVAWWVAQRWLNGFAYHVELHLWLFPAASATALLFALASVAAQSFAVARRKPIDALRYE